MTKDVNSETFRQLYEEWIKAISEQKLDWFEKHLSSDFSATAHVWPNLRLDKDQFIELDKQIVEIEADWQTVQIVPFDDLVVTVATLQMHKEVFRSDTSLQGASDEQSELATLASGSVVTGKLVTYTGTWQHNDGVWQIKDHRMVHAAD